MNITAPNSDTSIQIIRLFLTIAHLSLLSIGSINLLVILIILVKPYMRSITNVYIISLCLADFMYLANLILVAAAQINNKSWIFGPVICTIYHGTETTGKYASVIFVVLLAADRYCAMCRPNLCVRYRNYRTAISSSAIAWCLAFSAAIPLYLFSEVVELRKHNIANGFTKSVCIAKWPSSTSARWYITFSSIFIYVIPLVLMIYFNYHILKKLREALHGSRRLKRESKSRAPYHRVTCLVLWVVIFHVVCWSPFWLFNLLSSVFRLRIHTRFGRLVINVIHLFPYINCALNPLLYATHAENFRTAFRSLIVGDFTKNSPVPTMKPIVSQAIVRKRFLRHTVDPAMIVLPILRRLAVRRKPKVARCNDRSHSIFVNRPLLRASLEVKNLTEHFAFDVCNQQESQKNIMLHHNSSKMCDAENRNRKNYLFHWSCNKNKRISKHLPNVGQLQHHSLQPNERCKNGNSFTLTTVLFTSDESSVL